MTKVQTITSIDAAPAKVWEILVDFPRWSEWNPFIVDLQGAPRAGEPVRLRIKPPGLPGSASITAKMLLVVPGRELRWKGQVLSSRVMSGEHSFVLEPAGPGRTRFIHTEVFTGVLSPVFGLVGKSPTRRGFEAMDRALKARAEAAAAEATS